MRRHSNVITAVVAVTTLVSIAYAVRLSLDPNQYFFYTPEDRAEWAYPIGHVVFAGLIMLAEAALVWGVFVSSRPMLWLRCAIGAAILVPWAILSTMVVVHAPGYVLFHHPWVWFLVGVLALSGTASVAGHVVRKVLSMGGTADQGR